LPSWIRIRVYPTKINPKPWGSGSETVVQIRVMTFSLVK
jgi:hypothetical protein